MTIPRVHEVSPKKVREIAYKVGKIFIVSVGLSLFASASVLFIFGPAITLFSCFESMWINGLGVVWVLFSFAFIFQLIEFLVDFFV